MSSTVNKIPPEKTKKYKTSKRLFNHWWTPLDQKKNKKGGWRNPSWKNKKVQRGLKKSLLKKQKSTKGAEEIASWKKKVQGGLKKFPPEKTKKYKTSKPLLNPCWTPLPKNKTVQDLKNLAQPLLDTSTEKQNPNSLSGATHRVWLISGSNTAVSRTAYILVRFWYVLDQKSGFHHYYISQVEIFCRHPKESQKKLFRINFIAIFSQ